MGTLEIDGLGAAPGVVDGVVRFSPMDAVQQTRSGEAVVLVREMTSPADTPAIEAAAGVLTSEGGRTCHAAIVAREFGTPAVVGCQALAVDADAGHMTIGDRTIHDGARVRLDGTAGTVTFPGYSEGNL